MTDTPEIVDADALAPLTDAGRLATPEDLAAFQERFLRLLEHRTAIYTQGDSTSVPTHVAADLLRSICFVLGIDPETREIPERLLRVDLAEEYKRRLADIERRVADARQLWVDVCAAMPLIPNIALRDTLVAIGDFFKQYDFRSMAHDIPCMIDYPLCHPVPSELLGVDWIAEYLRRLMIEAEFLGQFEVAAIERVLAAGCADYVEDVFNLYEPVATNAIGLALIGADARGRVIGDPECEAIAARLRPLGDGARERVLREAAEAACDALGIADAVAREYLGELAPELLPRIEVGLARGSLGGVFVIVG
jgi:hypothetical protein